MAIADDVEGFGIGIGKLATHLVIRLIFLYCEGSFTFKPSSLCSVASSLWFASFVHFSACRISQSVFSPHVLPR